MKKSPQDLHGVQKYLKTFDCGCQWEVAEKDGEIIAVNYEPESANIRCPRVWHLISTGLTKGIFQLETRLGQNAAYQCKPVTEEELSDVISIIRPGVGDAEMDGKTLKNHYIDRKNGKDPVVAIHPSLEEILKDGYGLGLYQEDYMKIATQLAGFNGSESYALLKACAKKLPELMAKFKDKFIQGCMNHSKLSEEDATMIFGIIEAGQRYSFNKSHSLAYSLDALYFSAYPKAHFPRVFFLSELEYAQCIEDVGAVIDDAQNFKVKVVKPDLSRKNEDFELENGQIHFGLSRVKGVGPSKLHKLLEVLPNDVRAMGWNEMLWCLDRCPSDASEGLIKSGAVDFTHKTRTRMLFELDKFKKLNHPTKDYVKTSQLPFLEALEEVFNMGKGKGLPCVTAVALNKLATTINQLKNPPFSMVDAKARIFEWESQHLGFAFTCSEVDGGDASNCSCEEFLENKKLDEYRVAATINSVKIIVTKGKDPGREMAFIDLRDKTQKISAVAFPEVWLEFRSKLFEGNKILVVGTRGDRGRETSLLIKRIQQI